MERAKALKDDAKQEAENKCKYARAIIQIKATQLVKK
jgi:hypothetical protein